MHRPDRRLILALAAAGCGGGDAAPDAAPSGAFELVGHADLGGRGMNAALAVVGDTVYVGSRIDSVPVAIVDVSDPAAPAVVGAIGPPDEGLMGISSRELRADGELDLLVVLNLACSPELHGCTTPVAERENLRLFDISDRRAPVATATYVLPAPLLLQRGPHEMFLWRDPVTPSRALVHVSAPAVSPQYEVIDVSDRSTPARLATWDPIAEGDLPQPIGEDNILHSVMVTPDGATGWFSHLQSGLFAVDLSQVAAGAADPVISLATPVAAIADWSPDGSPVGPHSAVTVPGRDLLVATDEVYNPPWSVGCPWGWMRTIDVADRAAPRVVGELRLEQNRSDFDCGSDTAGVYTAHNVTATSNLALVTWHAAGLVAVDLADPTAPRELARFVPEPLPAVTTEDPALGGRPVAMWSYPVIQDGLIYVVDIRNGLYILRYTGEHAEEIESTALLEGNAVH